MKDVVLIQIRYHCNFSWLLHTSFPSFSLICWTSLFKILGFVLCSTITPPPIMCHFPNWFVFPLLSLQCNTVSLLTLFLVSHHPFFLHSPYVYQMFCNTLILTSTFSLPPCSIAIPSELFQFSPPCSESHVSSVPIFITTPFICVSFKLPSPFVLLQTNDQVGSVSALLFFLLSTPVWLILVFLIGPCNGDWAVTRTFTLSYHWYEIELQTVRAFSTVRKMWVSNLQNGSAFHTLSQLMNAENTL